MFVTIESGRGLLWEHDVAAGTPNLALVQDTDLKPILGKKLQAKLKPLFETRVRRVVYPIRSGSSEIELTIDNGTFGAGHQSSPIRELELELKRGDAAELFNVARLLGTQVPVQLAVTTKSERGCALITGKRPQGHRSCPDLPFARRDLPSCIPDHCTSLPETSHCEPGAGA
jgi:inorganic triphosphatase YgiF